MSKQKERDPRFKAVNSDPRFHTMPKKEQRVKVDDRFKAVIEQKNKFDNADDFYYVETNKQEEPMEIEDQNDLEVQSNQEIRDDSEDDPIESEDEVIVRNEQSSSRLALQNYDWNHLNAKNIYMLFHTLAEAEFSQEYKKDRVKRVDVYLSNFGEEKLNIENIEGPKEILQKAAKKARSTKLDEEVLRKYEKDRLKYYFAVIQFDSNRTAEKIYESYDGLELEFSGCKLDLRFVPENLDMLKQPSAVCEGLTPQEFQKIPKFINKAMGHSSVELTWDAPIQRDIQEYYDPETGEIDQKRIQEMVALDEEDENDENDARDIRAQLLSGTSIYDDFNKNKKKDKDIVITFKVGFGEDNEANDTDENRELIPKRKEYRDPHDKKSKRQLINNAQKKKFEKKREYHQKQELELLVDEKGDRNSKPFEADIDDQRFKAAVTDSKYAIDPTNPKYSEVSNKAAIDRKKKISK